MNQIQQIQGILGVAPDGNFGPVSMAALQALIHSTPSTIHSVMASSFADPADVAAYRDAKARGLSDEQAFKVGDNAIGCYGDDTSEGSGPSCALPPEDIQEKWGSVAGGRGKPVLVSAGGKTVTALLKDCMPHRAHIENGAGIDLNPDTVAALGLVPPVMVTATWQWA